MLVTCECKLNWEKILHQEANMDNVHLPLPQGEEGIYLCILPHLQRSAIYDILAFYKF